MSTKLRMLKCSFIWKLESSDGLLLRQDELLIPGRLSNSDDWQYHLWGSGQHGCRLIEWLYQDSFSLKQSTFMSFSLLLNEICILHLSLKKCWGFKVLQKLNSISTPDGGGQGAGKLNILAGAWQTFVKWCRHQSIALGAIRVLLLEQSSRVGRQSRLQTRCKSIPSCELWMTDFSTQTVGSWRKREAENTNQLTANTWFEPNKIVGKTFRAEFLCKKSKEGS